MSDFLSDIHWSCLLAKAFGQKLDKSEQHFGLVLVWAAWRIS